MKIKNENRNENSNKSRWLIFFTPALILTTLLGLAAVLPGCSLIDRAAQKYYASGNMKTGDVSETVKIPDEIGPDNSTAVSVKEGADAKSDENTGLNTNAGAGSDVGPDAGSDAMSAAGSDMIADELGQENILKGFDKLLLENKKPDELIKYIDSGIIKSSTATAGLLFEGLENSQKYYSGVYMNYLFEGDAQQIMMETFIVEEDFIKENLGKISDINLKNQLALIFDGGFKFVAVEGSFYPIIDYEYLKKYSPYLDEEYNGYLDIKAVESNEIYSRDAGLMISWDKLAKRVTDIENYLSKYPQETPRKVETGNLYMHYLSSYICGQDNTPTRDYFTNKIYDEVLSSYESLIENSPDTLTGKIIAQYLNVLQKNGFVLSDEILNGLDKYLKIPVEEYNLDSVYMISEQLKYLSYPSDLAALGYISLQNGRFIEKYDEQSEAEFAIDLSYFYAVDDLNSDGINDAAVILVADTGDNGIFYYLHAIQNSYFYIYSIDNNFLGDRVKIKGLSIKDSKIYIDMFIHKSDDPVCCPTDAVTKVFTLKDGRLIEN